MPRLGLVGEALRPGTLLGLLATWRSGYAAACKAVYTGSIPVVASSESNLEFSVSAPVRSRRSVLRAISTESWGPGR
jgi:hypothetical protein